MLPIQRIKIKDNLTKSLGDIFSPCDIFVIVIPSLLSALAWTWVSVTRCWRKLALDGRQIASTDTGNIYSASAPHSQLFPKFKAGLWAPRRGDAVSACQDTSRHQAPVIRTIHKNPCSLCSQWQEKTLWSWNVSDFIGHFSELLDTLLSVFPCLWVTECLISRLD